MVDDNIVLFTASSVYRDYNDIQFYTEVRAYDDYECNYSIERDVLELNEKYCFAFIVAISECDILRAGKLRSLLNLKGQDFFSAYCFRDKIMMKYLAQNGGVKVPLFERLYSKQQLLSFCEKNGFPVVLKPVLGSGSKGLIIAENTAMVNEMMDNGDIFNGSYEVEKYIKGHVYHTDGIMLDNELLFCVASKYYSDCLAFQDNKINSSYILSEESPIRDILVNETKKLLKSMVNPACLIFHAEFIVDGINQVFLCEIASRTNDVIKYTYKIDLNQYLVWGQCNIDFEVPKYKSEFLFGDILVPPQNGILKRIDYNNLQSLSKSMLVDIMINGETGKRYHSASFSCENIASCIVCAKNENDMEKKLEMVSSNIQSCFEWE